MCDVGLNGGHEFLGVGLRRLSRFRGFVRLDHCGLLRAYRVFGR